MLEALLSLRILNKQSSVLGKKIVVIGSGFAGLAAATSLAAAGHEVTVLEKNSTPGGRARQFQAEGFTFDMGPSWYWMPDVFEAYFNRFGKSAADYYDLVRLDPSYTVVFGPNERMEVPASLPELEAMFERYEPGSGKNLQHFLREAKYKYEVGMNDFVVKPSYSIWEFVDWRILKSAFRLQMFQSLSQHVRRLFKHPHLVQLLEFPVLFLGATSQKIPALYSLMNYADMALGTWYPQGGMYKIVEGMVSLAREQGVTFHFNAEVTGLQTVGRQVTGVVTANQVYPADMVVGGADYHHLDQEVLAPELRNYRPKYWDSRVMAPSSLLFYLGVNKPIAGLHHHNLYFDEDLGQHAHEIYEQPRWPSKPLFYVCAPSKTDPSVAPAGMENLFILIPLAPDLDDQEARREEYYNVVMERLERLTGEAIRPHVIYRRSYAHRDFKNDYHAYKGNAYGLANTLLQTAFLKPTLRNRHLDNFFYTGQLTTPGPGMPPSLISGQVVAAEVDKALQR